MIYIFLILVGVGLAAACWLRPQIQSRTRAASSGGAVQ